MPGAFPRTNCSPKTAHAAKRFVRTIAAPIPPPWAPPSRPNRAHRTRNPKIPNGMLGDFLSLVPVVVEALDLLARAAAGAGALHLADSTREARGAFDRLADALEGVEEGRV